MSKSVQNLLDAFNLFLEESSKKDYVFTYDEQIKLQNMIVQLNKHIDILIEYESKR